MLFFNSRRFTCEINENTGLKIIYCLIFAARLTRSTKELMTDHEVLN